MNAHAYAPIIERAYEETLGLLEEARDFVACRIALETDDTPPVARLAASAEQFRLTSRLSTVLAWLLHRKAVAAGETTDSNPSADAPRLDGATYWLLERNQSEGPLPDELETLLERSRLLYDRAMRLDAMIREDAGVARRKAAEDLRSAVNRRRALFGWNGEAVSRADGMTGPDRRSDTDRRR